MDSKNWSVCALRLGESLGSPRPPIDRILGVLVQVRAHRATRDGSAFRLPSIKWSVGDRSGRHPAARDSGETAEVLPRRGCVDTSICTTPTMPHGYALADPGAAEGPCQRKATRPPGSIVSLMSGRCFPAEPLQLGSKTATWYLRATSEPLAGQPASRPDRGDRLNDRVSHVAVQPSGVSPPQGDSLTRHRKVIEPSVGPVLHQCRDHPTARHLTAGGFGAFAGRPDPVTVFRRDPDHPKAVESPQPGSLAAGQPRPCLLPLPPMA